MGTPGCRRTVPATNLSLFSSGECSVRFRSLSYNPLTLSLKNWPFDHRGERRMAAACCFRLLEAYRDCPQSTNQRLAVISVQLPHHTVSHLVFAWSRCTSTLHEMLRPFNNPCGGSNSTLDIRTFPRRDPLGIQVSLRWDRSGDRFSRAVDSASFVPGSL